MKVVFKSLILLLAILLLIGLPKRPAAPRVQDCSAVAHLHILEIDPVGPSSAFRRYHLELKKQNRLVEVTFRHKSRRVLRPGFVRVAGRFDGRKFELRNDHPSALHDVPATTDSTSCALPPAEPSYAPVASSSITSAPEVPVLSSKPSAAAKLYLDFDGELIPSWGSYTPGKVPPFDRDGTPSSFSENELAIIKEIWQRVAEAYSPFNIDVTTVQPASFGEKSALRVVIDGDGSWMRWGYGGLAYFGGFYNASPNTVFAFSRNLNWNPKFIGNAVSHEAGHAFGLKHQSTFDRWGGVSEEYNPGNSEVAPIMGLPYYAKRALWFYGPAVTTTSYQDDLAILSGSDNAFGYELQDVGDSPVSAAALPAAGDLIFASGLIGTIADRDVFRFATPGGPASLSVAPPAVGATLDLKVSLFDSDGGVVASFDSGELGEELDLFLEAGVYYLEVSSHGMYGDIGTYTVTGSIENVVSECKRRSPTLTMSPSNVAGYPGTALTYNISVTSNDSSSCSSASFALSLTDLNGAGVFSPQVLTLVPGGTNMARLELALPSNSRNGEYQFSIRAANTEIEALSTTGSANYTVQYDTTPPSPPSNLSYTYLPDTGVTTLNWNVATDNAGVTLYEVYRDNVRITSTAATSYVAASPWEHLYYIRALDGAGNRSMASNSIKPAFPRGSPRARAPSPADRRRR